MSDATGFVAKELRRGWNITHRGHVRVRGFITRELRERWHVTNKKEARRLALKVLSRLVKPGGWRYPGLT